MRASTPAARRASFIDGLSRHSQAVRTEVPGIVQFSRACAAAAVDELPADRLLGSLHAAEHGMIAMLPLLAVCDRTRDDQPNHIRIQERVPLEIALMWQNMCPAAVYEVPEEELEAARVDGNGKLDGKHEVKLQVTPSNCIQCGAISAKGGRLTPPEGGDGPEYSLM